MNSNVTKQPLISVIVPVYNIIPYLPRCVESLRTQTYENLEILLIDDGSTDETPALCDRLAAEDERIRVFHKKNGGPSSARNFGLQQAGGEYVGFVDSFPMNAAGKILKYKIREQAVEKLNLQSANSIETA